MSEGPAEWPVRDEALWDQAMGLYDEDRLDEAMNLVRGTAAPAEWLPWYRMLEAEWLSVGRARVESLGSGVTLEWIPDEVPDFPPDLHRAIPTAVEEVYSRLGVERVGQLRVAILSRAAEAPWAVNPHGYFAPKREFGKVCLPATILQDPEEFREAVQHETAHAVTHQVAGEGLPQWLEEMVSMAFEAPPAKEYCVAIAEGRVEWMDPESLERAFWSREAPDEDAAQVDDAYEQASVLAHFLLSLGPAVHMGNVLREYGRKRFWPMLWEALFGWSRIERAFRREYHFGFHDLFTHARDWAIRRATADSGEATPVD